MTTPASETALDLAQASLKAQEDLEKFIRPHVKEWLKIEILHNRLDEDEAKAFFDLQYFEPADQTLGFMSDDEEIFDGYGDYVQVQGHYIHIPLEFFDNPEKFFIEAREAKAIREKEELERQMDKKKELIKRLEGQLAQVEATQAELDKLKTTN